MRNCFVNFEALFKFKMLLGWTLRTVKVHWGGWGKEVKEKAVHAH